MSKPGLPRHVAIIMDGNGRWAKQHALSVFRGHRQGVEALREIIRYSSKLGLEVLSLYAFSTENWSRPESEVSALMRLIVEFFQSEIDELHQNAVKIRILGNIEGLPPAAKDAVYKAQDRTRENPGLQLNIALNYGARAEIMRAARFLAEECVNMQKHPEALEWSDFDRALYTQGQPDVDLLIRTSGEQRLSNFLLCQCAYAEMMFPEKLWPDYTVEDFKLALEQYMARERRYGGRT